MRGAGVGAGSPFPYSSYHSEGTEELSMLIADGYDGTELVDQTGGRHNGCQDMLRALVGLLIQTRDILAT